MTWSDCVPVLTEELLAKIEMEMDLPFQDSFAPMFRVSQRMGPSSEGMHVLSLSLFFKFPYSREPSVDNVSEDLLRRPHVYGLQPRFNPWAHYIEPILQYKDSMLAQDSNRRIRIYLANDLAFLADRLSTFAEVMLMEHSSTRCAPGMLWRLLALEDAEIASATILDADTMYLGSEAISLTQALSHNRVIGWWRVPVALDWYDGEMYYRPIAGCYWGTAAKLEIRRLLKAYLWAIQNKNWLSYARSPSTGRRARMFGSHWPDYGSDEHFETVAVFPRLVPLGTLTLLMRPPRSMYLPIDIGYVTSANPASTVSYKLYSDTIRRPTKRHFTKDSDPMHFLGADI